MNIENRLKKIISDSRLSLPDFAKKVGVSRNTLVGYRDGTVSPSIEFLERVCEAFEVDRAELLLGEPCHSLETETLEAIIAGVERGLVAIKRTLEPAKKAQLITLLYEHYAGKGESLEEGTIDKYLRLAI